MAHLIMELYKQLSLITLISKVHCLGVTLFVYAVLSNKIKCVTPL